MRIVQESSLDWGEVEEALVVVRERKSQGLDSTHNTSELRFPGTVNPDPLKLGHKKTEWQISIVRSH